jgi:hypothetical protein
MALQAGELAVRRATGLTGFYDLRFAGRACDAGRFRAEASGETYEVRVRAGLAAENAFLTCTAPERRRARHFVTGEPQLVS